MANPLPVIAIDTSTNLVPSVRSKDRQARLLLVSLLENFAALYDKTGGSDRSKRLFHSLCVQLCRMKVIDPSDILPELSQVRRQYQEAFREIVLQTMASIQTDDSSVIYSLESIGSSSNGSSPSLDKEVSNPSLESEVAFDDLLHAHNSRFDEFVEISCLGRGAFGRVHHVRHKLDGREYAIKLIKLNRAIDRGIAQLQALLREAKLLASISHSHIVRYYASWIEHAQAFPSSATAADEDYWTSVSSSPVSGSASPDDISSATDRMNALAMYSPTPDKVSSDLTLFIQMELCHATLHDWLNERTELWLDQARSCFRDILVGLEHIHSKRLIHRDIKPQNIYWTEGEGRWKLGDFGLSTMIPVVPFEEGQESTDLSNLVSNTLGIGTFTYAAPEQLESKTPSYTQASDIYSLGLILFELLNIFATGMERVKTFLDLRAGVMPEEFVKKFPTEAAIIFCMMAKDPQQRPSAKHLLSLEDVFPVVKQHHSARTRKLSANLMDGKSADPLKHDSEDLIEVLKARILELETENANLKIQLQKLTQ